SGPRSGPDHRSMTWQIDSPVDQRPSRRRGVAEEDADLGILDPPGGAAVLALHAHRADALLQEPRFIGDQHPARITQLSGHERAEVIPDRIGVPYRRAQ